MAVASDIIPSNHTVTGLTLPDLNNSSMAIITSCERPTANTGLNILPPLFKVSIIKSCNS